ncbi:MAG: helix-turn-helix domain-containing protein [Ruminiclostridium sp.]|nr:helix-turn-helix domain-containing protein [Ruminiclostridium sp.]
MLENYPDIITIEDLCKILHIGRNKAYEFLNEKLIKSLKVGRKYIIPKKCVIDFLNSIG